MPKLRREYTLGVLKRMRNQRLWAKRMRNQRLRIYIQMSTVIHKFLLLIFSDFRVFPNL